MTCLKVMYGNFMFCGQERGYLTIVDYKKYAIITQGKVEHKEDKSHINGITKTNDKQFYVVATNKGLAMVKIHEKNNNIMIQR